MPTSLIDDATLRSGLVPHSLIRLVEPPSRLVPHRIDLVHVDHMSHLLVVLVVNGFGAGD